MKKLLLLTTVVGITLSSSAYSQTLSPTEKNVLIGKVEEMLFASRRAADAKAEESKEALEKALKKDSSTMALFYDAYQDVNYTQKDKKNTEFLAWKKANRTKLTSIHYRTLVSLELKWLLLSIEANKARDQESKQALADSIAEYLSEFYKETENIAQFDAEISQNMLQSEVAKFLKLDGLKINDWPSNPKNIDLLYEKFILPQARKTKDVADIKQAWKQRFSHDRTLIADWDNEKKSGISGSGRANNSAAMQAYLKNKFPSLQWQMHLDLFKNGAQREAAYAMFDQINKLPNHKEAQGWSKTLLELLTGKRVTL